MAASRDQNKEQRTWTSQSAAQRKPSPAVCLSVVNIKWRPDDLSLCLSSSDTSSLGVTSPMKRLICSQRGLLPMKSWEKTLRHTSLLSRRVNTSRSAARKQLPHSYVFMASRCTDFIGLMLKMAEILISPKLYICYKTLGEYIASTCANRKHWKQSEVLFKTFQH